MNDMKTLAECITIYVDVNLEVTAESLEDFVMTRTDCPEQQRKLKKIGLYRLRRRLDAQGKTNTMRYVGVMLALYHLDAPDESAIDIFDYTDADESETLDLFVKELESTS